VEGAASDVDVSTELAGDGAPWGTRLEACGVVPQGLRGDRRWVLALAGSVAAGVDSGGCGLGGVAGAALDS
jgi:hypothetical protein